jgi:hypothetical protein
MDGVRREAKRHAALAGMAGCYWSEALRRYGRQGCGQVAGRSMVEAKAVWRFALFAPGVLEGDGAVEDGSPRRVGGPWSRRRNNRCARTGRRNPVGASASEGSTLAVTVFSESGLSTLRKPPSASSGSSDGEQPVVEPQFGIDAGGGIDPMDGGAALHAFRGVRADGAGQDFRADERDVAIGVLFKEVQRMMWPPRRRTWRSGPSRIELLRRVLHEVLALDPELAEIGMADAHVRVLRVVGQPPRRAASGSADQFSITTFTGSSTAMRRGDSRLRKSRTSNSSSATSVVPLNLVMPMRLQKSRMAGAG